MSNKRKSNKRRVPRPMRRPPNQDEAMDIALTIYRFAEMAANGETDRCAGALAGWIGEGPVAALRTHYVATTAPLVAMGLMRKNFPHELSPEAFWIMERRPGAVDDVTRDAVCQVLVRFLNDDHATGLDMIGAHLKVHGDEGLCKFAVEAVVLLAGIIRSIDEQSAEEVRA
jgi:hypothetical protein